MKVLFLTNVPSPYRVDFFNELGKFCDLTVLFEKKTSDERDEHWHNHRFENFKGVFLKGKSITVDTAICRDVIKFIDRKSYDIIICGNFSSPTGIMAIHKMRRLHIDYYLEADGGISKNTRGFKNLLKKKIISKAKGCFSSGKMCDQYFLTYGADPKNIYRYPFTSISEKDIIAKPLSTKEKNILRKEMGMVEEKILISVGRFSYMNGYGKGYDTLLKVSEELPKNVGVYIIGDNPTEEFIEWKENKNLKNVHFIPFVKKDKLFKYYQSADLMVFLTRGEAWGLVVNEALANGLPVITTDACIGGVEMIHNGFNGYILPVNDVKTAREIILDCLSDTKYNILASKSIDVAKEYTIENMAKKHIEIFNYIIGI